MDSQTCNRAPGGIAFVQHRNLAATAGAGGMPNCRLGRSSGRFHAGSASHQHISPRLWLTRPSVSAAAGVSIRHPDFPNGAQR